MPTTAPLTDRARAEALDAADPVLDVDRRGHAAMRSPIQAWFAQRNQFEMSQGFAPADGIRARLAGTPPILGMARLGELAGR